MAKIRTNPRLYFTSRDQVFRIKVNGLMPSTVHNFYFERQKVAASALKPVGGSLGDRLITNGNGYVEFDYYFSSGLTADATTAAQAEIQAAQLAGNKEVVLSTIDSATLPDNFADVSLSYFLSHIRIQVAIVPENEYQAV